MNILIYPDPGLYRPALPVDRIGPAERKLCERMLEKLYQARGIGLSAPQVGVSVRVAVLDLNTPELGRNPLVLINPVITHREGEIIWEEGCLSIPGFRSETKRSEEVRVRAQNPEGREIEIVGRNLLAVVIQHELDHFDGKLLIDRAGRLKKNLYLRKLKKMHRDRS
ncbi:MAG: peptide deformylase [Proteobacteria bacterium]|nr:peptide deformylase [Pseudomonadota bacterium]